MSRGRDWLPSDGSERGPRPQALTCTSSTCPMTPTPQDNCRSWESPSWTCASWRHNINLTCVSQTDDCRPLPRLKRLGARHAVFGRGPVVARARAVLRQWRGCGERQDGACGEQRARTQRYDLILYGPFFTKVDSCATTRFRRNHILKTTLVNGSSHRHREHQQVAPPARFGCSTTLERLSRPWRPQNGLRAACVRPRFRSASGRRSRHGVARRANR